VDSTDYYPLMTDLVELDGTTDTVLRSPTWGLALSGSLEGAGGRRAAGALLFNRRS